MNFAVVDNRSLVELTDIIRDESRKLSVSVRADMGNPSKETLPMQWYRIMIGVMVLGASGCASRSSMRGPSPGHGEPADTNARRIVSEVSLQGAQVARLVGPGRLRPQASFSRRSIQRRFAAESNVARWDVCQGASSDGCHQGGHPGRHPSIDVEHIWYY